MVNKAPFQRSFKVKDLALDFRQVFEEKRLTYNIFVFNNLAIGGWIFVFQFGKNRLVLHHFRCIFDKMAGLIGGIPQSIPK